MKFCLVCFYRIISSQDVLCDADKPVSPPLQLADEYLLNW